MITIELSDLNDGFQRGIFGLLTAAAVSISYERGHYLRIYTNVFLYVNGQLSDT